MPAITSTIPPEVLALLDKLPLVKGESREQYLDFLTRVASDLKPADMIEWLWTLKFTDYMYESLRNRRYRVYLIDLQSNHALRSVILKMTPYSSMTPVAMEQAVARWKDDPSEFIKHGIDPQSVEARALVQVVKDLEAIDRISTQLDKSCDTILLQMESRREVFAARARRAAETFRGKPILQIEAPEVTIVPESESETTSTDKSSGEASVPESETPDNGGPASDTQDTPSAK